MTATAPLPLHGDVRGSGPVRQEAAVKTVDPKANKFWVLGSFVWMTLAYATPASPRQACPSTRQRSRSNPARPYISRLMTLSRLTWPSTCPLLHGSLRAARTASSSPGGERRQGAGLRLAQPAVE